MDFREILEADTPLYVELSVRSWNTSQFHVGDFSRLHVVTAALSALY